MKKVFLNRKNQSLFDTNVQMKDVGMERLQLVLDSSAIPESGTAKVRSRPTVNYFNSHTASDVVQGFAVPTPKVPVLPPQNGPKANGTVSAQQLHNGEMIVVSDDEEGEILIPPPPSVAPPPPPPQFIPPSPKFVPPPPLFGDVEVPPELSALQPPPMPAPTPPTAAQSQEMDFASLKPPPMPPPKPPSNTSSTNSVKASSPISMPPNDPPDLLEVPDCPTFTPPSPPVVKQQPPMPQKTAKAPPPKPVRMSSIANLDAASASSSTPAAVPSSFNPQNTAKVYSIPKTTLLGGGIDRDVKPKSILLLEDPSGDSFRVHVNGNGSTTASPAQTPLLPAKPARNASSSAQLEKDLKDLKDNLAATLPAKPNAVSSSTSKPPTPPNPIPTPPKPATTPSRASPKLPKVSSAPLPQEPSQTKVQENSQEKKHQYSPLLTHKLNNLKANESSGTKEGVTSPLALLMAAKERERQRSSLSRENSSKSSRSVELPAKATIQPSESKPNSFTVIPKSSSSSSLTSQGSLPAEKPDLSVQPAVAVCPQAVGELTPPQERTPVAKQEPKLPAPCPAPSSSPSHVKMGVPENQSDNPIPALSCVPDQENGDLCVPFIPPPPEFANSDPEEGEGPPSTPPPEPPSKAAVPPPQPPPPSTGPPPLPITKGPPIAEKHSTHPPNPPSKAALPPPPPAAGPPASPSPITRGPPTAQKPSTTLPNPPSKAAVPPPPPLPATGPPASPVTKRPPTAQKPKPPTTPQLSPLQGELKARMAQQTKPKLPQNLPSTPTSASQATLLSILQKKMLEMDPKLSVPAKEADNSTDEWGSALSDEEGAIPVPPKLAPKANSAIIPPQSRGLDMRELETRVAQKKAENIATSSKSTTSNGPAKQPYGMTFTVRPGTKQPITLVSKGD